MNETVKLSMIFAQPCVNGTSHNLFFNFSLDSPLNCGNDSTCASVNRLPGASVVFPLILGLTGVIGQIIALVHLHHSTSSSTHRTPFYIMLATLIWVDLFGKLITTPFPITAYLIGHWVGGKLTCHLHGFCMALIGILTHFLVVVMALERYLGIRCGYFYTKNVTCYRTKILLVSLLFFGFPFCSLPLIGIGQFKLHYPGTWCHINQHFCNDHPWPDKLFSCIYTSLNLACLLLVGVCNFVVVGALIKMKRNIKRPAKISNERSKKPKEKELQMVILLVVITVTFIVSWAPLDFLMISNVVWPPMPYTDPIRDVRIIRLVSINQIVDPWSYIICRLIFRSSFWKRFRISLFGRLSSFGRMGSHSEHNTQTIDSDAADLTRMKTPFLLRPHRDKFESGKMSETPLSKATASRKKEHSFTFVNKIPFHFTKILRFDPNLAVPNLEPVTLSKNQNHAQFEAYDSKICDPTLASIKSLDNNIDFLALNGNTLDCSRNKLDNDNVQK